MKSFQKFTLLELMIVIVIIVIMISFLLPAVNRVRDQAKAIKCQANLHQMGLIIQTYTNDFKGFFLSSDDCDIDGGARAWNMALINAGYATKNLTFYCPSSKQLLSPENGLWRYRTFGARCRGGSGVFNLFDFKKPSRITLLGDSSVGNGDRYFRLWSVDNSNTGYPYLIHSKRTNFLGVDGHIAALNRTELFTGKMAWNDTGGIYEVAYSDSDVKLLR